MKYEREYIYSHNNMYLQIAKLNVYMMYVLKNSNASDDRYYAFMNKKGAMEQCVLV